MTRTGQRSHSDDAPAFGDVGGLALSILFWVAVWLLVARLVNNELLLASPQGVVAAFGSCLTQVSFWTVVGDSALRIVLTSTIASLCAAALGALSYRAAPIHTLCAPVLQVMKSAPVACVVVIVLVAWGASGAFTTIVAFVAFPPAYVAMRQALEHRPRQTEEALRLLGVPRWKVLLTCTWPAALPFFVAASKTTVALSWRAGITAELLCLPLGSIGAEVYASKLTLDSAQLLAWTIVVMVLSWVNEKLVVALLQASRGAYRLAVAQGPKPRHPGEAVTSQREAAASHAADGSACTLELAEVSKAYADHVVLDGFSLHVAAGARVCLMAPTGRGKSTVIRLLAGVCAPDAGVVQAPASIGIVFQEPTLIGEMSALENVELVASGSPDAAEAAEALRSLIPPEALHRKAAELSGGTKRLVELARAMLSGGSAVLLDEPFAGLDDKSHQAACAFILRTLKDRPLVIATHDENDARLLEATVVRL